MSTNRSSSCPSRLHCRTECLDQPSEDCTTNGSRTDTGLCRGLHWICPKTRTLCARWRTAAKTNLSQMRWSRRRCWSSSGYCSGVTGLNTMSSERHNRSFSGDWQLKKTRVKKNQRMETTPCCSLWGSALTGSRALCPLQEQECLSPTVSCPKEPQLQCTLAPSTKHLSLFFCSPSETPLSSGALMAFWLMEMIKPSPKWCSGLAVTGTDSGPSWWVTLVGWLIAH